MQGKIYKPIKINMGGANFNRYRKHIKYGGRVYRSGEKFIEAMLNEGWVKNDADNSKKG